ncbi:ComEC/Rec2 family competence protein [Nonomuraea sp. NPDC052129]|uniref:ComEC/Rec2 family competence protein n=1 Tax=Nonomuraea sp. NPDC052129 TaxID=3154651 RepID=UPI00342B3F5C
MPHGLPSSPHSWSLALPALATWAATLTLLNFSPTTSLIVSAVATVAALLTALNFSPTTSLIVSAVATVSAFVTLPRRSRVLQAGSLTGFVSGRTSSGAVQGSVRRLWRNVAIATLTCLAATSASVALRVHAVSTGPVADLATRGAQVTAQITLTDDPKIRRHRGGRFTQDRIVVPATLTVLQTPDSLGSPLRRGAAGRAIAVNTPVVVFAQGPEWSSLLPSQSLEVAARLAPATPGDLIGAVLLVRGSPRVLTSPSWIQAAAGTLRAGLRTAADVLPADQRGLLPGLVVGDVSRMDPQLTADLNEAGLSHLNAVSGANLAIVASVVLALSRLAGLPLALRAVLAAIAMLAFAVVARPSPSVLRALLMGMTAAIALGTGRTKDGVAALSASILLLILFDPELAHSYGFALSVFATAGILLLAPRWRAHLIGPDPEETPTHDDSDAESRTPTRADDARRHSDSALHSADTLHIVLESQAPPSALVRSPPGRGRRRLRLPRWAAEAVAVSAAAQVAVTPVLVLMSGQLTLVAIPANLLAGPAVAPATILGFVAALVAPLWPQAAQWLVIPAGYAVGWIILVAQWAVSMPLATLPWPGGLPGLGLLMVAVAVMIPVLRRRTWRTAALTMTAVALVVALVVRPMAKPWPPPNWLMVVCDVGQGDGMVLAAGPGRGIVVDTGPDPVVMDRCLRRLDVRDVPLLLLTHPHADHVDGLPGVLRNRRVGAVIVSPQRVAPQESNRIATILARHRIPEWTPPSGSRWQLGPSEMTILAPDPAQGDAEGQGEGSLINNSSIVARVRWRAGSALLSGDIETEAQDALLRRLAPRADILKVPHHGSRRLDPAFFASVGARAALISVGADNDYGHPAPSTIALLHRLGARVYRTDRSGDLAVIDQDGQLAVVARGP